MKEEEEKNNDPRISWTLGLRTSTISQSQPVHHKWNNTYNRKYNIFCFNTIKVIQG